MVSLRRWQSLSESERRDLNLRMFKNLTPRERWTIREGLEQLEKSGFGEEYTFRRVKGYDFVDGLVLIHLSVEEQHMEPWFIPISEKEARFCGWTPPTRKETTRLPS